MPKHHRGGASPYAGIVPDRTLQEGRGRGSLVADRASMVRTARIGILEYEEPYPIKDWWSKVRKDF